MWRYNLSTVKYAYLYFEFRWAPGFADRSDSEVLNVRSQWRRSQNWTEKSRSHPQAFDQYTGLCTPVALRPLITLSARSLQLQQQHVYSLSEMTVPASVESWPLSRLCVTVAMQLYVWKEFLSCIAYDPSSWETVFLRSSWVVLNCLFWNLFFHNAFLSLRSQSVPNNPLTNSSHPGWFSRSASYSGMPGT